MKTRTLFIDLETAPNLGYTWGKWEQNVIEFKEYGYILCFAYKWLGDKTVRTSSVAKGTNDKKVVDELWQVLQDADIVIAHNGQAFDVKKANARFAFYKLPPPSAYHMIDTRTLARKYFKFESNKLDELCKYLGIGGKMETGGFQLWLDCMAGNKQAWKKMLAYNKHDIVLLENIYNRLRPWMTNHPNVNVLSGKLEACPICESTKLQRRGYGITRTGRKQRFQCQACGGWSFSKVEKVLEIR